MLYSELKLLLVNSFTAVFAVKVIKKDSKNKTKYWYKKISKLEICVENSFLTVI